METLRQNFQKSERGQSLVELSISILFMLMLVAGVVDLGRAFFTYIALRDAAQEGAAFASVARTYPSDPMMCNEIRDRAQSTSDTQIVDLSQTSVSIFYVSDANKCNYDVSDNGLKPYACWGNSVRVVVKDEHFKMATPFLGTIVGDQEITISASILDTVVTPLCGP